jgi:hypothetical protein
MTPDEFNKEYVIRVNYESSVQAFLLDLDKFETAYDSVCATEEPYEEIVSWDICKQYEDRPGLYHSEFLFTVEEPDIAEFLNFLYDCPIEKPLDESWELNDS